MRLIVKLLLAQVRRHWFRTLLALGGVTAAVAMVVVVVGGYDLAMSRANSAAAQASQALGRFNLIVRPGTAGEANRMRSGIQPPPAALKEGLLEWLREHRSVKGVMECCEMTPDACPAGPMFRYAMYRPGEMVNSPLLGTASAESPYPIVDGQWLAGDKDESVVVDQSLTGRLGGGVGTTFQLATETGRHEVRIGGVLETPARVRSLVAMYVSPGMWQRLTGKSPLANRVLIELKDGVDEEGFAEQITKASAQMGQAVLAETPGDFREQASRMAAMMGPPSTGGFFPMLRNAEMNLAILAAMFIIFNTLSMGLQERSRQMAMLRAIGMTRSQLAGLIASEATVLALVGWLAGVAVGWYLMQRTITQWPGQTQDLTLHLGLWLGMGALTAFGATFLAAAIPAFLAARKRPLEGMAGGQFIYSRSLPGWLVPLGLALIAVNPLAALTGVFPEPWRTRTILPASFLTSLAGFAMILPVVVFACERTFGRLAGLVFGLNHRFLARQLSANLWKSVGCVTALMVGLGLYVTIQIWGQSMMVPFLVTSRCPDAVVTVFPAGVPNDKLSAVGCLPGVQASIPMILTHPELADLPSSVQVGGIFSRDVIYIGCDARKTLDEQEGMMGASFVRGNAEEAFAKLDRGGHCLITDSLYLRAPDHYDVGKTIDLKTADEPGVGGAGGEMRYTIAGVVQMPGWHLLTKSSQMRRGLGRVGGIVVVSTDAAKKAYPDAVCKTFWLKLAPDTAASSLEGPIIKIVDPDAKPMRPTSRPASRPLSRPTSRPGGRGPGMGSGMGGSGMPGRGGGPGGSGRMGEAAAGPQWDSPVYCRIADTRAMPASIRQRADGIIDAMTNYPLLALGLASLAVINTMMVSVRARSWEMGILRSIGLTRWQLLRQILAEGLLIGLLASVSSVLFGLLTAWTGIWATGQSMGVTAPFVIPWERLLLGIGTAVVLCVAASLWPAILAARRQPLRLLQEGRAME